MFWSWMKEWSLRWGGCFLPERALAIGDVMLAPKIALETDEAAVLAIAKSFSLPDCRLCLEWRGAPSRSARSRAGPPLVTAAAPCREGASTRDEDDFATASSIGAAGGRRKNACALVLLGPLNGV
jgi:hypothetical protein